MFTSKLSLSFLLCPYYVVQITCKNTDFSRIGLTFKIVLLKYLHNKVFLQLCYYYLLFSL